MYVPISMTLDGDVVYSRRLEGIESRAADMSIPLRAIGASFKKGLVEQFRTQGAYSYDWPYPGAGPWRKLSDPYKRWKEQHYPGRPILVAQGTMKNRSVLAGDPAVSSHHLFYTPADARQTRRYEYRRASRDTWAQTAPENRTTAWGHYLVRSPHTRTYNMAEVAYYHQTGAGHLPRRPPVAFNLGELREWDRILLAWLNGREPLSTRLR